MLEGCQEGTGINVHTQSPFLTPSAFLNEREGKIHLGYQLFKGKDVVFQGGGGYWNKYQRGSPRRDLYYTQKKKRLIVVLRIKPTCGLEKYVVYGFLTWSWHNNAYYRAFTGQHTSWVKAHSTTEGGGHLTSFQHSYGAQIGRGLLRVM